MIKVDGTVVHNNISGGFWGIKGDDGKKYCPVNMSDDFKEEGLRVSAEMARVQVMSVRMWGIDVEIKKMSRLGS